MGNTNEVGRWYRHIHYDGVAVEIMETGLKPKGRYIYMRDGMPGHIKTSFDRKLLTPWVYVVTEPCTEFKKCVSTKCKINFNGNIRYGIIVEVTKYSCKVRISDVYQWFPIDCPNI